VNRVIGLLWLLAGLSLLLWGILGLMGTQPPTVAECADQGQILVRSAGVAMCVDEVVEP
jgi:hypothetical protein